MPPTEVPTVRNPRRPGGVSPRPRNDNFSARNRKPGPRGGKPPAEHEILFQKFFKSVGPRTYAAQVKQAGNGNHYLVLTEGKRDDATAEVRKTRLFVYSEDFVEFFRLIKSAAEFIKDHPLPAAVKAKRDQFWQKHAEPAASPSPRPPHPASSRPGAPRIKPPTISR